MIYLCIPSHDEETTVGVVLWKARQVMAELGRDYQLLVADDASTDRTPDVLEPYTRVLPLTVMRCERRRGYAASLEMLLREAARRSAYPKRDIAIVLQADFTQDPGHIPALIKRVESGADIAVSNAVAAPGSSRGERLGHRALRWLLSPLGWPEGVEDPLCGYNAYRLITIRKALDAAGSARLLRRDGELANAELLRAAAPHARRIEVVEFTPRPERRQRPSRTRMLNRLRHAYAYRRGVPPAEPLPLDRLPPDSVMGFAHGQRSLLVESLREAANGNGKEPGRRRKRSSKGGARRRSVGPRARSRSGSKPSKPGRAPEAEAPGSVSLESAGADAEAQPKQNRKRRRGRRGGKRRRGQPHGAEQGGTQDAGSAE